jgi:branched-subunit amino acid transport protein
MATINPGLYLFLLYVPTVCLSTITGQVVLSNNMEYEKELPYLMAATFFSGLIAVKASIDYVERSCMFR